MNEHLFTIEESVPAPHHISRQLLPKTTVKAVQETAANADQNWTGQTFGLWTVLDRSLKTRRGERKWLCRCECGTQRYVLERALKSGSSLSCGCLRKKNAADTNAYDLGGQVFGELYVLRRADDQSRNGGIWWLCQCSCGNSYEAPATLLVTGKRTHCGGKDHEKNYSYTNITGQRFHRLVALHPLKERDPKGSVMWHCRCDCGKEVDVAYNSLMYSKIKSCGCQKKEHDQKLGTFLNHVAGTSVEALKSKKIPANNTTGCKGVYFIRGKYVAKIVFQKKAYYLGAYDHLAEAAQARKEAEEMLFDTVAEHFERWKAKADLDGDWARENPVQVSVSQDAETKRLSLLLLPELNTLDV